MVGVLPRVIWVPPFMAVLYSVGLALPACRMMFLPLPRPQLLFLSPFPLQPSLRLRREFRFRLPFQFLR